MSLSLSNILFLFAICRILPTSLSRFVGLDEDSEGSGYDQGGSGFYSQDGSAGDSDHPKRLLTTTKISDDHKNRIMSQGGGEIRFKLPRDYDIRPVGFSVEKLKTLLKTKEVIAGIIGGGVMGLVLAMAAAVIYQWKKKDVGYTMGKMI